MSIPEFHGSWEAQLELAEAAGTVLYRRCLFENNPLYLRRCMIDVLSSIHPPASSNPEFQRRAIHASNNPQSIPSTTKSIPLLFPNSRRLTHQPLSKSTALSHPPSTIPRSTPHTFLLALFSATSLPTPRGSLLHTSYPALLSSSLTNLALSPSGSCTIYHGPTPTNLALPRSAASSAGKCSSSNLALLNA